MRLRHLGYVGQNHTLGRTTGRTLRLANVEPERVRGVIRENLDALRTILEWNVRHGIRFFRIASSLIPFASHPSFPIDWRAEFADELDSTRAFAHEHGVRLSTHPGQYTVLNSPRDEVVANAVAELEYHAALLAALAPVDGTMTLHVGGVYGDKERASALFARGVERLSPDARRRLVVENDDRLFDADDVLALADELGLRMVFDFFHHRCHHRRPGAEDDLQAILRAVVATWGDDVPKMHLSSPREPGATHHADHVTEEDFAAMRAWMEEVPGRGPYDVILEAKEKERAVLRYLS